MKLRVLAFAWVLFGQQSSMAQTSVNALVTDAYDGDTLTVNAEIWPDLTHVGNVRVRGVDTPEMRGQCEQERALAIAARDFVRALAVDQSVTLSEIESDLYGGRVLARVHLASGEELAGVLIEAGYGRPYEGGARSGWCDEDIPIPQLQVTEPADVDDPLAHYDDNDDGRISCAEARAHAIAPVERQDSAYAFMNDADGDGVVCE